MYVQYFPVADHLICVVPGICGVLRCCPTSYPTSWNSYFETVIPANVGNVFDLTALQIAFELIFQLYNFLSEAKADNDGLREPECWLLEAKNSVARKDMQVSKRPERLPISLAVHPLVG